MFPELFLHDRLETLLVLAPHLQSRQAVETLDTLTIDRAELSIQKKPEPTITKTRPLSRELDHPLS